MSRARAIQIITIGFLLVTEKNAIAIINGKDVKHSDSPISTSLIALQMSEIQVDGSLRYYKGTAFLIEKNLLLTAGHNVAYIPEAKNIEAIFSSTPCWGLNACHELRIKASKSIVHPEFRQTSDGTEYDLAIIKLEENVPNDYFPIDLIESTTDIGGLPMQVLGFGTDRQTQNVPLSAFRLRSIPLFFVEKDYHFGSRQKFWLDQKHGGICGGDSGGPSIFAERSAMSAVGLAIHVAQINGVQQCLSKSAFTDLLFFKDWIDATISQLKASEKQEKK